ncbi:MAG: ABC transporter permease [Bacteroidota bacterium]
MIKNYLLVAVRNFNRQLTYSIINVLGLSIGIACSLVIFLYVYGEWSYDRHFKDADKIYRIGISFFNMGQFANGPERLMDHLPKTFEGIEAGTRFRRDRETMIVAGDKSFKEPLVYYADSGFFQVFSYQFIEGDAKNALKNPGSIVITESIAEKYFNDTRVLGKILLLNKDKAPYAITGVVKDEKKNSHLKSSIWISNETMITNDPVWTSASFYNYVKLNPNNTEADLRMALDKIIEAEVFPAAKSYQPDLTLEAYKNNENAVKFYVHPLTDIYLKSKLNLELSPGGNETNIYIFSVLAFFILLLAAVNFINLTTARASRRAKEIGIRKTMGTSRGKLIIQFLTESVLLSAVALMGALVLASVCLSAFEFITGDRLPIVLEASGITVLYFLLFAVVVGVLSGLYPALYLTSFMPVKVLKGNVLRSGGEGFRNFLVVFQFAISICLIICTVIILQQLNFIRTKDLGFNQENIVTIDHIDDLKTSVDVFRNELIRQPGVVSSSLHTGEPASKLVMTFNVFKTPEMPKELTINTYFGDNQYLDVMGYELIKGRNFSADLASDTSSVILNESAVEALGLGENPIGAKVNEGQYVIGVIKDFHWESLRNDIAPVAILLKKEYLQLALRFEGNNGLDIVSAAEAQWKKLAPDSPFRYHFVDDNFGELLKKEKVFGKAMTFFTMLAIFISCLGLYGLAAFTAEQRTREIGIRKVLGATTYNIMMMLNRNFTRLVLVAVVVAVPVSIFIATRWLEGFAYRTNLQFWVFGASVFMSLVIAWITVSYHSLRAAWINPADTLKYE